ncbi:MAG TPA: NUDIX domain-containing protein [Usitatibacter sp.]|jgi:8-oxo-dGTP diphosphatase|nr:NUDIX domain-containing protein [Usitatibacter sp.]
MRHRIAAGALVLRDDRLLLVHHRREGAYDFWVPPGGGIVGAEALDEAAAREVAEETGLVVEATALAYIDELLISGTRQCKFWYLARIVGGTLTTGSAAARAEHIVEARFLGEDELGDKTVFPTVIRDEFWVHLREGFERPRFLGVREAVIKYPDETRAE